nr:cytochrome P450 2K3-like [Pseudochaenichthys georgianus]
MQKVVVLAGYKTVKQALVNHAEEFEEREVTSIFYDFNKGHDFGMGKRITEGKIIEECGYLIEEFNNMKRFEYKNPDIQAMLERDHETIRLTGTASILIYKVFPWLGPWRDLMKLVEDSMKETRSMIVDLKETLNPDMCRCIPDP